MLWLFQSLCLPLKILHWCVIPSYLWGNHVRALPPCVTSGATSCMFMFCSHTTRANEERPENASEVKPPGDSGREPSRCWSDLNIDLHYDLMKRTFRKPLRGWGSNESLSLSEGLYSELIFSSFIDSRAFGPNCSCRGNSFQQSTVM